MSDVHGDDDLAVLEGAIDSWLAQARVDNPMIAAVDRDAEVPRRWYVRLWGEEKDVTTVWLTLGQRTLRYETYVMPAPEENEAAFYHHLLVRNLRLHGWAFAIGEESAVFLTGAIGVEALVDDDGLADALDRIVGSGWEYVERCFKPALRLGFASRFAG